MHIHTIQLNIERLEGGIQHMDATEFGAYMSLLICCYKSNNQISSDDKRLARMARVSPKVWSRIKPIISEKFTENESYWSHDVVQKELDKCLEVSTNNKANALKRWNSSGAMASQPQCNRNATKYQIPNNNNKYILCLEDFSGDYKKYRAYLDDLKKENS